MKDHLVLAVALLLSSGGPMPAAETTRLESPSLQVEITGSGSLLLIESTGPDAAPQRHVLRATDEELRPVATGWGARGDAGFATWDEGADRWLSYTRDGGRSWSAARPLATELRFLDGAVAPGNGMPPSPGPFSLAATGRLHLIQFKTISLPEWREELESSGAKVLAAFPHNAHIVRLSEPVGPALTALESLSFVERVEPYHPWYRLSNELRDWVEGSPTVGPQRMRVRVLVFERSAETKQQIVDLGGEVLTISRDGRIVELLVDRDELNRLAAHDGVQWIDPWSPPSADMNLVREDSGADWLEDTFGYCGKGVRGEIMDAGIRPDHPDFDGILLHTFDNVGGHGTATYGIVFGNGYRDLDGNALATGQLPCGQGIFADHDLLTDRFAHTQELKQAPYFASFQSNSWGSGLGTAYTSESVEMDDIIWQLDIAILNSQSNEGTRQSRPEAWAKNVISVGGIRHRDTVDPGDDYWGHGASIGPASDGRIKPDISYWYDMIYAPYPDVYTDDFGGTSAATPESAGVLGLILELWSRNAWGTNPTGSTVFERQPHASTLKALLINTAQQYPFSGTAHDRTRVHQGWGRPSARVALERAANSLVVDEEEPLSLNEMATYVVQVPAGESELKITMVYSDPPGEPFAAVHRVNDVNLRVVSPSATVYHGNVGLDAGNYSTSGGSSNNLDTVENVFVQDPQAGNWTVEVQAVEINQDAHLATPGDDVAFALVVTGASSEPHFTLAGDPVDHTICAADAAVYELDVDSILGFLSDVTLTATGVPAGAAASLSPGIVTPSGNSTLTVSDTEFAAEGEYTLRVSAQGGGQDRWIEVGLDLFADSPADAATLVSPAQGATGVDVQPILQWEAVTGAVSYQIDVATDPGFANIIYSAPSPVTIRPVTDALPGETKIYWRVQAINPCGPGPESVGSFTTRYLPQVLLVDDSDGNPDIQATWAAALAGLGVVYDLYDVDGDPLNEPAATTLDLYDTVLWITGDSTDHAGPGSDGAAALTEWLNGSGCLLLSSPGYVFSHGWGDEFWGPLGISTILHDRSYTSVTGVGPIFGELGPYSFTSSSFFDTVEPDATAQTMFAQASGGAGVYKDAEIYRSAYWGFGLHWMSDPADGLEALGAFLDWCDGLPQPDGDNDEVPDSEDCAPQDPAHWATPSPVTGLALTRVGPDNFTWIAPSEPGAQSVSYDVLRSSLGGDFGSAACVDPGDDDTSATDETEPLPGGVLYYLVRVENDCGSEMGTGTDGSIRTGAVCMP